MRRMGWGVMVSMQCESRTWLAWLFKRCPFYKERAGKEPVWGFLSGSFGSAFLAGQWR